MTLPPLPEARKPDENGAGWFTSGQMREYGALCRQQALEEALNCYSPDDTATDWADKIRSLK